MLTYLSFGSGGRFMRGPVSHSGCFGLYNSYPSAVRSSRLYANLARFASYGVDHKDLVGFLQGKEIERFKDDTDLPVLSMTYVIDHTVNTSDKPMLQFWWGLLSQVPWVARNVLSWPSLSCVGYKAFPEVTVRADIPADEMINTMAMFRFTKKGDGKAVRYIEKLIQLGVDPMQALVVGCSFYWGTNVNAMIASYTDGEYQMFYGSHLGVDDANTLVKKFASGNLRGRQPYFDKQMHYNRDARGYNGGKPSIGSLHGMFYPSGKYCGSQKDLHTALAKELVKMGSKVVSAGQFDRLQWSATHDGFGDYAEIKPEFMAKAIQKVLKQPSVETTNAKAS